MMYVIQQILRYAWASPWTLFGLVIGCFGLATGGSLRFQGGTLEIAGGLLKGLLRSVPIPGGAVAMTLGHVVLGQTHGDLDRCRSHEAIHIRQYERWGIAFVPAYLGIGLVLWLRGKDPYLDNPFEVEAYKNASHSFRSKR
jgi:hypothetical protein